MKARSTAYSVIIGTMDDFDELNDVDALLEAIGADEFGDDATGLLREFIYI